VVSHDRDFLDGLVTKVYEFKHNRIKENIGGIYDFLRKKKIVNLRDIEKKDKLSRELRKDDNASNKQKYLDRKEHERSLRKLRKRLEDSERLIEEMEKELSDMDIELITIADPTESAGIYGKYENLRKQLNEEMNNWTRWSHEVDEFLKTTEDNGIPET
jgi:ATP-binding cassette subfamily F protein 3